MTKIPALMLLASLLAACGGGGGLSGIPQADACNQAAQAACAKVYACDSAIATPLFGTQAQCQTMVLSSCGSTGFQCGATSTYHGDQAQTCKDGFTALSCDALTQAVLPVIVSGGSLGGAFTAISQSVPSCSQICTTP